MTWNKLARVGAAALVAAALASVPALAQPRRGGGMGTPRYDKATEQTVSGVVEDVQTPQNRRGGGGVHLAFKTGDRVLDVHVGPSWWLAEKNYVVMKGDALTITGSLVKVAGNDALIAREIVKGTSTWTLRNADGYPLWSRGGNRTQ
jgi:hypothetical protein